MPNSSDKKLIKNFVSITNASNDVATSFLKESKWNVEAALNEYFSNPQKFSGPDANFVQNLTQVYEQYKDANQDAILIDGTLSYFEDLGIDPTQVSALIVALELKSETVGEFTRENFINGWTELNCDTLEKMKAKISSLEVKYQSSKDFKKIYVFAFKYSLSPGQRSLGLETAIPLWECLIGSKYSHLESWIEFLQTEYNKAISKDTWNQFYDFIETVSPDMTDYDQDGAWPYAIDEFVTYARQKLSLPTPAPSLA